MTGEGFAELVERLAARLDPVGADPPAGGPTVHAAVALLLRPVAAGEPGLDGDADILFIRRGERVGDPWSGHLALPGGRPSENDADLLAVAVRETREEVGIDVLRGGRVLGRLPAVEPMSVFLPPLDVTPFVALAPAGAEARPDPSEVSDAFWLPLSSLRRAGPSERVRRLFRGEWREWRAYPSPAGPIWGITERILSEFLRIVG